MGFGVLVIKGFWDLVRETFWGFQIWGSLNLGKLDMWILEFKDSLIWVFSKFMILVFGVSRI